MTPEARGGRPQIAVAIGGPNTDRALRAYDSIAGRASIAEIRVDLFAEPADLKRLIMSRPCPVVVTCRAQVEGGRFQGSEEERLDVLRQAAALGAEFIDVERFAFPSLGPVGPARVIVSQHDFMAMPDDLTDRWTAIRAMGADIVKLAGMAADACDLIRILDVLASADWPTIAMAMGDGGVASRLLALRYPACLLTYASLDDDVGTAPGQISLNAMHEVFGASDITPSTHAFGVVAPSIESELTAIYNRLLQARGVDAVCVPLLSTRPNLEVLRALLPHGFLGFHVHGAGQQLLQRQLEIGCAHSERSESLNSLRVADGAFVASHVASPEEQVDQWLMRAA